MGQLGGFPAQSHTMQQAGPAPSASGRFEVEGAGASDVEALAGWYNAVRGGAGPATRIAESGDSATTYRPASLGGLADAPHNRRIRERITPIQ